MSNAHPIELRNITQTHKMMANKNLYEVLSTLREVLSNYIEQTDTFRNEVKNELIHSEQDSNDKISISSELKENQSLSNGEINQGNNTERRNPKNSKAESYAPDQWMGDFEW